MFGMVGLYFDTDKARKFAACRVKGKSVLPGIVLDPFSVFGQIIGLF
jgi:hypothetical protein